jgi:hypothetical protein
VANYQQVLRTVTYANGSDTPDTTARVITFVADDGTDTSNVGTTTVTVVAANDEQVLAVNTGTTVAEGSIGTVITSAMLSTTDDDNTPDQLIYTLTAVPGNGTLRLSGGALIVGNTFTQDDIDNNRVTYDHNGSETVLDSFDFDVDDGVGVVSNGSFAITVTPVNDAPVHTFPASVNATENAPFTFTGAETISVADAEVGLGDVEVRLTMSDGTVSLSTFAGLTFSVGDGDDDATMTFTGSLADVNAALDGLLYRPTYGFSGAANLEIRTSDLGASGAPGAQTTTDNITVNVTDVNSPPVNSVPAAQMTPVDTALVFEAASGNAITISDPDAGGADLQVTLTATNGILTLGNTAGLTTLSGDGTANVTMTGTIGDINAALEGMSFDPTPAYVGAASVQIDTDDQGATPAPAQSDSDVILITVNDEAPIATDDPGDFTTTLQALSPLSYYRLGETSGGTVNDDGSVNNDGTYNAGEPAPSAAMPIRLRASAAVATTSGSPTTAPISSTTGPYSYGSTQTMQPPARGRCCSRRITRDWVTADTSPSGLPRQAISRCDSRMRCLGTTS